MLASLTIAAALAHPVGERFATQTTILEVHRDHLQVDYVAEVPHALLRVPGDRDPLESMAIELQSGLLLQVDGAVVPMTRRGEPLAPEPTSEHTWTFPLRFEAKLPAGAEVISVSTANLQDAANYFAGDVRLYDGLQLTACSLLQVEQGRVVRDDTLRWRRDEAARVLTVTLAPSPPAWWQALAPSEPRHAGAARVDPHALTPGRWGIAVALAAALGGAAGRSEPRAALLLAVGVVVGLAAPSPALLALGVLVGGAIAARWRPLLPWLACGAAAALAAATDLPRAALIVAGVGATTMWIRREPSVLVWPLAGLAAIWLLLQ